MWNKLNKNTNNDECLISLHRYRLPTCLLMKESSSHNVDKTFMKNSNKFDILLLFRRRSENTMSVAKGKLYPWRCSAVLIVADSLCSCSYNKKQSLYPLHVISDLRCLTLSFWWASFQILFVYTHFPIILDNNLGKQTKKSSTSTHSSTFSTFVSTFSIYASTVRTPASTFSRPGNTIDTLAQTSSKSGIHFMFQPQPPSGSPSTVGQKFYTQQESILL